MSETMEYRGMTGSVEYCEESGCWFGKVIAMPFATWRNAVSLISYEGATKEELRKDFQEAVDEYIQDVEEVIYSSNYGGG